MRPRFMNRGSANNHTEGRQIMYGFNEAPIHESGKCGWYVSGTFPTWRLQ